MKTANVTFHSSHLNCKFTLVLEFVLVFIILLGLLVYSTAFASEIVKVETFDGVELVGKLDLPEEPHLVSSIVVFVPGSGPCTYDNHRKVGNEEFNYFELFAKEFTSRGIGFFRYNSRGTQIGDSPPWYDKVDRKSFAKSVPSNQAQDIEAIIIDLKKNKRLIGAKVFLFGWSEGSIIASMVAERGKVGINALLLAGYANDNLYGIIQWQLTGGASMVFYKAHFDTNQDGKVSNIEYKADPHKVVSSVLQGAKFNQLDKNGDGVLTSEDFATLLKDRLNQVMKAIENGDDDWIWKNYFRITSSWLKEHFKLEPNKDRLLKLNLPIYIFHGEWDNSVPVEGAIEIREKFKTLGKTNLKVHVFKAHDHDLNFIHWPLRGHISEGLTAIFKTAKTLSSISERK